MRLWSIHPRYLDTRGLVALWRESLLAQRVLRGDTRGYRNHPQLLRFKTQRSPQAAIARYLTGVWYESRRRGFNFDREKIAVSGEAELIPITDGQIEYEFHWLCHKLTTRNPQHGESLRCVTIIDPHPFFIIVRGNPEPWERQHPME